MGEHGRAARAADEGLGPRVRHQHGEELPQKAVAGDAATGGGFGDEQIVFAGDGNALLTGGIRGGGTGEDGDLDATEWELVMNQAASLILAGGAEYWLGGGVRMNYGGGSETTRGEGRGILQVTNAAVLDTTEDGQGGASSGGATAGQR